MSWADVKATKPCSGNCDWMAYLSKCEEILNNASKESAWPFVEGVAEFVKRTRHITPKQKNAIDRINIQHINHDEYDDDGGHGRFADEFWK